MVAVNALLKADQVVGVLLKAVAQVDRLVVAHSADTFYRNTLDPYTQRMEVVLGVGVVICESHTCRYG